MDELEQARNEAENAIAKWLEAAQWEEVDGLWCRGFKRNLTIWNALREQLIDDGD